MTIPERLRSRKLWVTITAAVSAILLDLFGVKVDPALLMTILGLAGVYTVGQGVVDAQAAKSNPQSVEALNKYISIVEEILTNVSAENKSLKDELASVASAGDHAAPEGGE